MQKQDDYCVVIPARLQSSRLFQKPLQLVAGLPLVVRVLERVLSGNATQIVVAVDDVRVQSVVQSWLDEQAQADLAQANRVFVRMTDSSHLSGTDRLAEVVQSMGWSDQTWVVNVQGDEPLIPLAAIEQVVCLLRDSPDAAIATLAQPFADAQEFLNPNAVKVVHRADGRALYFSRAPIPHERDFSGREENFALRHIGLYAYRAAFLKRFSQLAPSPLEQLEKLEQLRALWYGEEIVVGLFEQPFPAGVDTLEDLIRINDLLYEKNISNLG